MGFIGGIVIIGLIYGIGKLIANFSLCGEGDFYEEDQNW